MTTRPPILLLACLAFTAIALPATPDKTVIAHRGASGYLPEHTLEAYAMAYGQGADFIEPDLMLTSDGVPIALHDRTLDATTDVAERFPGRARDDGKHYAIDFTLEEIEQLAVKERIDPETGEHVFPARWPNTHEAIRFRIATLAETLELVRGLNHATGRDVGVYPEIKSSSWHREQGVDFERAVLEILADYGYTGADDNVIVQAFEPESLLRLRELGTELTLVQLIGGGRNYDRMMTGEGLDRVAAYADGIGPSMTRIFESDGTPVKDNFLVREAQARGLIVHPYTMRADRLPGYADSYDDLLEHILFQAGADGVFTDHPDLTVRFLKSRQ